MPFLFIFELKYIIQTHTRAFNCPFPGLPGWSSTRKVKPMWILLKQETVSGSGISWAICKSASRSRRITMLPPHPLLPLSFLQAGCPFCWVKANIKRTRNQNCASIVILPQLDWSSTLPLQNPPSSVTWLSGDKEGILSELLHAVLCTTVVHDGMHTDMSGS